MMLDKRYDPATLDDLAALVASARKTSGNSWQIPGIKAALVKAAQREGTVTLAKLARVALDVAADLNAKTPGRIAQDGPWWNPERVNSSDALPTIDFATDCHECLKPANHPWHPADHEYVNPRHIPPADHTAHATDIRTRIAAAPNQEEAS